MGVPNPSDTTPHPLLTHPLSPPGGGALQKGGLLTPLNDEGVAQNTTYRSETGLMLLMTRRVGNEGIGAPLLPSPY